MTTDCLDQIIGITETNCDCYGDIAQELQSSESGLFLDELIPLKYIKSLADCESGGVIDIAQRALERAKQAFTTELSMCLHAKYQAKGTYFNGNLGDTRKRSLNTHIRDHAGIKFCPHPTQGAVLKASRIGIIANTTASIPVEIYDQDGQLIDTIQINAVAGQLTYADTDLSLPLYSESCDQLCYYFLYKSTCTTGYKNKIDCGCGGKKKTATCGTLSGVAGNANSDGTVNFEELGSTTATAYGLVIQASCLCQTDTLLCDFTNYKKDAISRVVAESIYFRAGLFLLDKCHALKGGISKYTLLGLEEAAEKYDSIKADYDWRLDWLCQEMKLDDHDCYTCKGSGARKGQIRV